MAYRALRLWIAIVAALALAACGDDDGGGMDGGPADSGEADTGTDTGEDDAGMDAEIVDGGPIDAGPMCGNARVEEGEECDDGSFNSDTMPNTCRTSCALPSCGDGVVDTVFDEQCDDMNVVDDDLCSNACVSAFSVLCQPCADDAECGREVDVCVTDVSGSFCATACDPSRTDTCAMGYSCIEVMRDGTPLGYYCLPDAGACAEHCTNGLDDDADGSTDCADADCTSDPMCGMEVCDDAFDNDGDGTIDCFDADCASAPECADPCDTTMCNTPPADSCDGFVAVSYAAIGMCSSATGSAVCTYPSTRTDCSLSGRACSAGTCVDPCAGACTTPPANRCEGSEAVTYPAMGACTSPAGVPMCSYAETRTDCTAIDRVCSGGACLDPCVGFACSMPPAASCSGNTLTTYPATGTCASPGGTPACTYAPTTTDCTATDRVCSGGACVDPCVGFACSTPPASTCSGNTLTTYAATGTCTSPGGSPSCSYAPATTDCTATDRVCSGGACVDPCVGFACNTPPPATCSGNTLTTYAATGTCTSPGGSPTCSYAPTMTDCTATSQICQAGACVTPPPEDCTNGVDDDFDGAVDCADSGCSSAPECTFGYNFGFEDWSMSDPPRAWLESVATDFAQTQDTTLNTGTYSAGVTWSTTDDRDLRHAFTAPGTTGTSYTVHAWVLDGDPSGEVVAGYEHFDGTSYHPELGTIPSVDSSMWQEIAATFTFPAGMTALRPFLRFRDTGTFTSAMVRVDDVAVTVPHVYDITASALDGTEVATGTGVFVNAAINDAGTLYLAAHQPFAGGGDNFVYAWIGGVGGVAASAPWMKSGSVAGPAPGGALVVLAAEESDPTQCEWSVWSPMSTTWVAVPSAPCSRAGGYLQGVIAPGDVLGMSVPATSLPAYIGVAFAPYGTTDGGALVFGSQAPASTDMDGDIDAEEVRLIHRATILSGRLP